MVSGCDVVFPHEGLKILSFQTDLPCGMAYVPFIALQGFDHKRAFDIFDCPFTHLFFEHLQFFIGARRGNVKTYSATPDMGGNMLGSDEGTIAHDRHLFDGMFEFTDITRPFVFHEHVHDLG